MTSRVGTIFLIAGLAPMACAAYGADAGATALLPADSSSAFKFSANAGEFAKMSAAAVTGQPFSKALRIEVTRKPQRSSDVQVTAPVDSALASGDVLLVSFWMRSGGAGDATLDAGFRTTPGSAATLARRERLGPQQVQESQAQAAPADRQGQQLEPRQEEEGGRSGARRR